MAKGRDKRRLTAILAADVVGYSKLIEADESGARAELGALRGVVVDPTITVLRRISVLAGTHRVALDRS